MNTFSGRRPGENILLEWCTQLCLLEWPKSRRRIILKWN